MPGAGAAPDAEPNDLVPVPQAARKPTVIPYYSLQASERYVSLPAAKKSGKWSYPAYGEQPSRAKK
jgi:hypothetical protein